MVKNEKLKSAPPPEISDITVPNKQIQRAFTLAEVLITIGIIGIVAAITIPSPCHKI